MLALQFRSHPGGVITHQRQCILCHPPRAKPISYSGLNGLHVVTRRLRLTSSFPHPTRLLQLCLMAICGQRTVRVRVGGHWQTPYFYTDRFLPFSLLHSHEDQYRFSTDASLLRSGLLPDVYPRFPSGGGDTGNLLAMAGFHDQAVLDANCCRIASSSSATLDDNLNLHDPPEYDMNLVLHLLQSCLRNDVVDFWAKIEHEHQFSVALTSMEALRSGFIRHIFDGDCVLRRGAECKAVVNSEDERHSMSIRVIDSTIQWVEGGILSAGDFTQICEALDITSGAKQRVRSLTNMLVAR